MEVRLRHVPSFEEFLHGLASLAWTPLYAALLGSLADDGIDETHAAVRVVEHHGSTLCLVLQVVEAVLEPLVPSPVVIVNGSTESIQLRTVATLYDILVAVAQAVQAAVAVLEVDLEIDALDDRGTALTLHPEDVATIHEDGFGTAHSAQRQLLVHLHVALLGPGHVLSQCELHVQEVFTLLLETLHLEGQAVHLLLSGTLYASVSDELALLDGFTVLDERPGNLVALQGGEIVLVEDLHGIVLKISLHAHVLINLLHLEILGLGRKVGQDDTIHAEHTVVGPVTMVAAVAHVARAVGGVGPDGLIHPVPDGSTAEEVGTLHGIPVVLEVAQ